MIFKAAKSECIIWGVAVLFMAAVLAAGCASNQAAEKDGATVSSEGEKLIKDVFLDEGVESVSLHVRGNQPLTFTPVMQSDPLGLILYFPETRLESKEMDLTPESDVINAVKASQIKENGQTTRVEISLKRDADHEIFREGDDLRITFQKEAGETLVSEAETSSQDREVFDSDGQVIQTATRLHSVFATPLEDGLKVFVGANGTITNYKAFTIESPARIVFDIFNVESPYRQEKLVPVKTKWVKRVRYYGYPDRLRVVLDTSRSYLSAYTAYPVENGLLIHVGSGGYPRSEYTRATYSPKPVSRDAQSAREVSSVYATQLADGMTVTVRGDGAITNYKTLTSDNPPQIIIDIYNVASPYGKEQFFPVDAKWVKSIRQTGYPDKVRIIINTEKRYLSTFTAHPDNNGMVVFVGGESASGPIVADAGTAPYGRRPQQGRTVQRVASAPSEFDKRQPAWVNRIDFIGEDAGKSTLIVGTTRPVACDMIRENDKELNLKLYNARIPDFRRRPLITTRFESGVDEIMPTQKSDNSASFEIKLRESVPYYVEQEENLFLVHFEASSIPPAPIETAAAPELISGDAPAPASRPASPKSSASGAAVPVEASGFAARNLGGAEMPPSALEDDFLTALDGDMGVDAPEKQYTGEKIALDFYETDIKNVFRILREISGKNFAVDHNVTGKVTLTLDKPVPWDQVLDLILKMNQLGKTFEGDIIRIATLETIQREEEYEQERKKAQQSLKEADLALEPLVTEYIAINYSNAGSEIKPHLESILTKDRGSISVDSRTNMIIMTDTEAKLKQAREIVDKLDRVTPQVIIEARVVEASTQFSKQIGVQWGASGGITDDTIAAGSVTDPAAVGSKGVGPQRAYDILGGTYGYDMAVNLPVNSAGAIGFNFTRIAGSPLILDAALMAMETKDEGRIVSAPRILTLDNKAATIKQGYEYPYTVTEEGEAKTEFKEITLELNVTPHITPDNRISMKVAIKKEDIFAETADGPALTKKEATTELLVNDGDTVVIGGIIKTTETYGKDSVPGFNKIPLLGWLFKANTQSTDKQELLIFLTPKIVQLEQKRAQY